MPNQNWTGAVRKTAPSLCSCFHWVCQSLRNHYAKRKFIIPNYMFKGMHLSQKKVLAIKASASACKLPLVGLMLSTTLIKWNLQGPPYTNTIGIQGNKWNNQREEKSSWKLASASRNAESLVVYLQPYCVHPDSISTIHLAFGHHWNRGHQTLWCGVFPVAGSNASWLGLKNQLRNDIIHLGMDQNPGKWMFIPLKMYL